MKKMLIFFVVIEALIILMCLGMFLESDVKTRTLIIEQMSQNEIYRVRIYEIGETYPLGSAKAEIQASKKVDDSWEGRYAVQVDIGNEGGLSKEHFKLDWLEEGVIVHVVKTDRPDIAYRIHWEDIFSDEAYE